MLRPYAVMDMIDIRGYMTGVNICPQFSFFIVWISFIDQFSRRGWGKGGIVILASFKHHFIRVHENLEQHPSNNISIFTTREIKQIFKNQTIKKIFK